MRLISLHQRIRSRGGTPAKMEILTSHETGAAIRRKQASLSFNSEPGNSIARALINAKIDGQITVLKQFGFNKQADVASSYTAAKLTEITSRSDPIPLLSLEGNISIIYWKSLADTRLKFARYQQVPKHWHAFGTRQSLITFRPRGATEPGNALANYLYGILASEIAIAAHAVGLDPELGILHTDKADRASLAYDLMEPIRPIIDSWLFQWLLRDDDYDGRLTTTTLAGWGSLRLR
jgi:CRISPR-associated endonuclease Cas1